jgi:threonylcarbamoyladenosine tRNA methylthiotransferase MtaB
LGKTKTILLESENKDGFMFGFTENYVKVKTPFNEGLINTTHQVHLTKIDEEGEVLFEWIHN